MLLSTSPNSFVSFQRPESQHLHKNELKLDEKAPEITGILYDYTVLYRYAGYYIHPWYLLF